MKITFFFFSIQTLETKCIVIFSPNHCITITKKLKKNRKSGGVYRLMTGVSASLSFAPSLKWLLWRPSNFYLLSTFLLSLESWKVRCAHAPPNRGNRSARSSRLQRNPSGTLPAPWWIRGGRGMVPRSPASKPRPPLRLPQNEPKTGSTSFAVSLKTIPGDYINLLFKVKLCRWDYFLLFQNISIL